MCRTALMIDGFSFGATCIRVLTQSAGEVSTVARTDAETAEPECSAAFGTCRSDLRASARPGVSCGLSACAAPRGCRCFTSSRSTPRLELSLLASSSSASLLPQPPPSFTALTTPRLVLSLSLSFCLPCAQTCTARTHQPAPCTSRKRQRIGPRTGHRAPP